MPFGQVQVLCGLQVAPCWQGGTQGVVTAAGTAHDSNKSLTAKENTKKMSVTHAHGLTCLAEASSESLSTAAPVEAHTYTTILTRPLTLNRLWGRDTEFNRCNSRRQVKTLREIIKH